MLLSGQEVASCTGFTDAYHSDILYALLTLSGCYHMKEGNVLFNDALNTFYLRLYGVRHMVKDHSDSEREETSCRHMGYCLKLAASFFYMHHSTDGIAHTTAFVTPVVEHWLEPEIVIP